MPILIKTPSIIKSAGNKEKTIKEYFGNVNSKTSEASIAIMESPQGWEEPGQCPQFNEYTVVIRGSLKVNTKDNAYIVNQGEAILTLSGEWVKYSTPFDDGASYIAVCVPAFSLDAVNRDID